MSGQAAAGFPVIRMEVRSYTETQGQFRAKDKDGNRREDGPMESFTSRELRFEAGNGAVNGVCRVWVRDGGAGAPPFKFPFKRGDIIDLPISSFSMESGVLRCATRGEWLVPGLAVKG